MYILKALESVLNNRSLGILMPRGRPVKSQIRQNIIEILYYLGRGYGYDIAKIYNEIYPTVTQRSVYYHLRKGVHTKELEIHQIKVEKGDFSWGTTVEKIYYTLGDLAEPRGESKVKDYLQSKGVKTWEKQQNSKNKFTTFVAKFRKGK